MKTSKPITERQQAFLDAYRVHGKVKPAAEQAGCSRELHYGAMRTSETYREEFSLVQLRLADELEEAMWQRAVYGVKIPKFYRGEVIGYDIRYSDTLLMRLMEANDPEKFGGIRRELQQESGEDGFCVRWDRDEVARPTLPRMTGPQPPAPPRPPPVPSISELGIPVTHAEWAAARGITETATCGPVDQEKLQRWAAGEDFGSVEWVPDEAATDLVSDDADAEDEFAEANDPGRDDSDVDFCVRSDGDAAEEPASPPWIDWDEPIDNPDEQGKLDGSLYGSASGEGRGGPLHPNKSPGATYAINAQRRSTTPLAGRATQRHTPRAPRPLEYRPLASQPPLRNPSQFAAPVQRDAGVRWRSRRGNAIREARPVLGRASALEQLLWRSWTRREPSEVRPRPSQGVPQPRPPTTRPLASQPA